MTERASRRSRVVRSAIHAELSDERRFYSPIDRSRLRCVSLSLPPSLSLSLSLSLRASPASISPRVYERFLGAASWDFGP